MRVLSFLLLLLSCFQDTGSVSWRSSTPLGAPKSFVVLKKDLLNAKTSSASLTPSSVRGTSAINVAFSGISGGASKPFTKEDNEQEEENEKETAEIARGGASTRVRPVISSREESVVKSIRDAEAGPSSSSYNSNVSSPSPAMSRKERRKKKKEASGSAAVYAKKLKNRNNLNIRRKVMHAGFGLFFAGLNILIPKSRFVPGMAILTSATLLMELLRYKKGFGWMNDALHFTLGSSLRKHEMQGKFTGSFYFFLGVTITSYLYPTTCASLGICQLALADPSASYFGRQTRHVYWSRIENGLWGFGRNKGLLGFVGGALFCFPFNYRVLSLAKFGSSVIPGGNRALITASLALGLAGAFADLAVPTPALCCPKRILGVPVPPFHVDDNFVVPIFSGYACTKIFQYLNWPLDLEFSKYVLL